VRVFNYMKEEEARQVGVDRPRSFFRIDSGKGNMSIPAPMEVAVWREFKSVPLGNGTPEYPEGDHVGVVSEWKMPGAFDGSSVGGMELARIQDMLSGGEFAKDAKAADWAGHVIADVCGLDAADAKDKATITRRLAAWIKMGGLKIVHVPVKGRSKTRKRPIIRPDVSMRFEGV
jgi:hypothetical protein